MSAQSIFGPRRKKNCLRCLLSAFVIRLLESFISKLADRINTQVIYQL